MKYILLDDDISILPMPNRVYNALKRNKVNTVGEMIRSKEEGKLEGFAKHAPKAAGARTFSRTITVK